MQETRDVLKVYELLNPKTHIKTCNFILFHAFKHLHMRISVQLISSEINIINTSTIFYVSLHYLLMSKQNPIQQTKISVSNTCRSISCEANIIKNANYENKLTHAHNNNDPLFSSFLQVTTPRASHFLPFLIFELMFDGIVKREKIKAVIQYIIQDRDKVVMIHGFKILSVLDITTQLFPEPFFSERTQRQENQRLAVF